MGKKQLPMSALVTLPKTGLAAAWILLKMGQAGYYEENNTDRLTSQLGIHHRLSDKAHLHFKNSYTRFDRSIAIPAYLFKGLQQSTYSELTYSLGR